MKKLLAVILTLAIMLSLASMLGCSKDEKPADEPEDAAPAETTPADAEPEPAEAEPEIDLENSKPNEYVAEKLAAGMEVLIGRADAQLNDAFNQQRMEGFKAACEDLGFTVSTAVCDGDIVLQIEQVENFIQMECALIACTVHASESFEDLAAAAEEAGTYLTIEGLTPEFHLSGACNVDNVASGTACAEMASYWVSQQYPDAEPDSVHAAVLINTKTAEVIKRSDAMVAIGDNDESVSVVYTQDDCNSLDGAYNAAESAFTVDPDIKLVIAFGTTHALGVNNYVVSMPDINIDEYGIFTTGVDPDVFDLIDIAAAGGPESAIRGCIAQGYEHTWDASIEVVKGLLFDGQPTPYIIWEPLWAITYLDYEFDTRAA